MNTRNSSDNKNETLNPSQISPREFADASPPNTLRLDDTRLDELSGAPRSPRNGALWLASSLLTVYAIFSLGVWSAQHSSRPPVIGPIETRATTASAPISVHVAGAVRRPGVYVLSSDARVFQALEKAGGALSKASTETLNLADWAQDGARIEVPFKTQTARAAPISAQTQPPDEQTAANQNLSANEEKTATETSQLEIETASTLPAIAPDRTRAISSTRYPTEAAPRAKTEQPKARRAAKKPGKAQLKTVAGLPRALTPDGKLSDNASPQFLAKHPLDLNKINREQLEALPGVGPSLAQKILDFRTQNKGFKSVEELDGVSGIGEKKLAALKPLLYVAASETEASPTPMPD